MGSFLSKQQRSSKKQSEDIDLYLKNERKKSVQTRDLKILLLGISLCVPISLILGAGESGKSTFMKQMKIIHLNGFTQTELVEYRSAIYKNIHESIRNLLDGIEKLGIEYKDSKNKDIAQLIRSKTSGQDLQASVSSEFAVLITKIWSDDASREAMDKTNQFYIMDSAKYLSSLDTLTFSVDIDFSFFDNVSRIGAPDYLPNEDDVLRSRVKTTGISETKFSIDKLNINMYDVGGQRSERKKWIHCFEGVTSVIFIAAISEYDQVLLEDSSQNRMAESIVLFESIVNSRWFVKSSIILFLNKIDLFKEKLKKNPLGRYFPEYAGDEDFTKASKFMLWRFKQVNRQGLAIYPHLTCATDTRQIRVVFSAVKDTLIKNSLKSSGIM